MKRTTDWQAALLKHWPVVTDGAIDAIEAEAQQRWMDTGCKDQLLANLITVCRSLRGEVARMETAWSILNSQHVMRFAAEIMARDGAIEILAGEGRAAA